MVPGFLQYEILLKTPTTAQARWLRAVVAPDKKTFVNVSDRYEGLRCEDPTK
jgi:hypothetical protein